jgi:sigma-B regulation protein RsbU (phosphoserine phosphatase)
MTNFMKTDSDKSRDELIRELNSLRPRALEAQQLTGRIEALQKAYDELKQRYDDRVQALDNECTARDQTEEALRMAQLIIDKSPVVLFRRLAGDNPQLVYVSENIRQFGYSAEEFLNGTVLFKDIVHPDDMERIGNEIRDYADQDAETYTQLYRILTRDGQTRWLEDQTSVVRDETGRKVYNQGIVVDITARKIAEDEVRKSEEKFRRIIETAGEGFLMMNENLRIVYVNDSYCRMLGYERAEILGKTPLDLATEEFRQFMTANRERLRVMDYRKFEGSLRAKDGRIVPVLIHGNALRDTRGEKIGNVSFVVDLTEQKKALELAGKVQKSLIPGTAPRIAGLDAAGRSDSCQEVGGDYFDFLYGPEYSHDTLKVVVGDISGHGVDAALLMTSARAFIRLRAAQPGSPSQVVSSMNRDLASDMEDTGHFMTLFFMEIDPRRGSARWVRAGHDPALIYRPGSGNFEELVGKGLALGVDRESVYMEHALEHLAPGTVIALGTDGIWEASDPKGRIFGKDRFRRIIRECAAEKSETIIKTVFSEIDQFTRGLPSADDITLVIIKIEPPEIPAQAGEARARGGPRG